MDGNCLYTPRKPKFSNPSIALATPNDADDSTNLICEIPNILSKQEAITLAHSLDKGMLGKEWGLEGYDRQNRVQRYSSQDDEESKLMEESFGWLFDRIASAASHIHQRPDDKGLLLQHRPYEVIVTEHTPSSCRSVVDTFEQFQLCPCLADNKSCSCYIAQVTLVNNAIHHIEKPQVRDLECWDVALPPENHSGQMTMEMNGVIIKTGDSLWNWRGRIDDVEEKTASEESSVVPSSEYSSDGNSDGNTITEEMKKLEVVATTSNSNKKKKYKWSPGTKKLKTFSRRSIIISFRGIHPSPDDDDNDEEFTLDPKVLEQKQALANRPLSELLTIIVTTSPIRSNPSTQMLEHTFDTFTFAGEEFAFECNKVIICDGCRVLEEVQGNNNKTDASAPPKIRIYANGRQNLRNGGATMGQSKNYQQFKEALRKLCDDANNSENSTRSPFRNTRVVELEERHGYGFALRHALRHCVDTPYVCVIQHDRNFMRLTPMREVVKAIVCDPRIKYVGMSMKSNLMYYDIFCGKVCTQLSHCC